MRKQLTAFYLETLLMIAVFIGVILILTHMFALAKEQSDRARLLTNAVTLAENAAEAMGSAAGPAELRALLEERGNAVLSENGGNAELSLRYAPDMTPDPEGALLLRVNWETDGALVRGRIWAGRADTGGELYTLTTAVNRGEG